MNCLYRFVFGSVEWGMEEKHLTGKYLYIFCVKSLTT